MFYLSSLLAPFTPRAGRVSQSDYILRFVVPFVVMIGLTWLAFFGAPGLLGMLGAYLVPLGWTVLFTTGDAYNIRRWNDLGSSAALYRLLRPGLVILPILAFALQFLVPAHLAMAGDLEALAFLIGMEFGGIVLQPAPLAFLAITFAAVTANVLYLSVTPGQQGANAYGPDPHGDPLMPVGKAAPTRPGSVDDDPVKRALADYHARQRAEAAVQAGRPPATPAFGRKRQG